jgi:hypothetical protein
MRNIPLTVSDIALALRRAERALDDQNTRTFRTGLKPETGIAAVGLEKTFPFLTQPNPKQQVWVDKKGRRIKLCTKRRSLESGTTYDHDASATLKDCASEEYDILVFASVEMPKSWKDTFPEKSDLTNPQNYRLWLTGWMDREEFNRKARMVDKGKKESPTWSASADCKSIKHRELHPMFKGGK